MSYAVYINEAGPWLVIEYSGLVSEEALVAARTEAAALNAEGQVRSFILDFSKASGLVLASEGVRRIAEIDRKRAENLPHGRCAIVSTRETVELGTSYLGAVSPLDLDFRSFRSRAEAEAWLRDELDDPPPPLPRSRRR